MHTITPIKGFEPATPSWQDGFLTNSTGSYTQHPINVQVFTTSSDDLPWPRLADVTAHRSQTSFQFRLRRPTVTLTHDSAALSASSHLGHYFKGSVFRNTLCLPYIPHLVFTNWSNFTLTGSTSSKTELKSKALCLVHPVEQKSIGLKFSKSRTGSHVTYSCHHNSSRFTFPIFAHSWRFSVFNSLQSITPYTLTEDNNTFP